MYALSAGTNMKRPRRIRRVVKWAGLAICLCIGGRGIFHFGSHELALLIVATILTVLCWLIDSRFWLERFASKRIRFLMYCSVVLLLLSLFAWMGTFFWRVDYRGPTWEVRGTWGGFWYYGYEGELEAIHKTRGRRSDGLQTKRVPSISLSALRPWMPQADRARWPCHVGFDYESLRLTQVSLLYITVPFWIPAAFLQA